MATTARQIRYAYADFRETFRPLAS